MEDTERKQKVSSVIAACLRELLSLGARGGIVLSVFDDENDEPEIHSLRAVDNHRDEVDQALMGEVLTGAEYGFDGAFIRHLKNKNG